MKFIHINRQALYKKDRVLMLGSLLLMQVFLPCNALSSGLLIVYPSVKMPYQKIYADIIKGINNSYPGEVQQLEIKPKIESKLIEKYIDQHQPDILVTLGKHSLNEVRRLALPTPIIAGALIKSKQPITGISMTPDPEILLTNLFSLAPFVTQVYVVANVNQSAQLKRAKNYLKHQDKTLYIATVKSIQEAADEYLNVINHASANDAIWLMRGAVFNDPSILSLVLEAAWKKKIVVFSSNPNHVKRGALFSVYPDNEKMGQSLAQMAQQHEQLKSTTKTNLLPLRNLLLIVNKRTSKHLGIFPNNIRGLAVHRTL